MNLINNSTIVFLLCHCSIVKYAANKWLSILILTLEKTFDTDPRSTSIPNKSKANALVIMFLVRLQYLSKDCNTKGLN
jgi:hypothetical protein